MQTNETWDAFFGNPIIGTYLNENEMPSEPPQAQAGEAVPEGEESGAVDLEQLTADYQQGTINQEDLVGMYKTGKLSKEDIESVVQGATQADASGQDQELPPGEQEPTEEELFSQQIDQTNDMFVKFSIYDKIGELKSKLDYFEDNFEDIQSDTYHQVIQLKEFLNILSSLVFNIETTVAYQMYGSILLQLTELFEEYNRISKINDKLDAKNDKELDDYRSGEKSADVVDQWADDNKNSMMEDQDAGQDHGQDSRDR